MNKTRLSEICGMSRQKVYSLLNNGLSEEEILKKYFVPKEIIKVVEDKEYIYSKGVNDGYEKGQKDLRKEYDGLISELKCLDKALKDLKAIKDITKKIVINNQRLDSDKFDFRDVNEIYEIVKDY